MTLRHRTARRRREPLARSGGAARRAAALLSAGLLLAAVSCSGSDEPTFLGKRRISIGYKNDQPGLSYKPDYKYSGFETLLGAYIQDALHLTAGRGEDVPSADRVTTLIESRTDLVIASFSITAERMAEIDFVGPYAITSQGFLTGPAGEDIRNIEDLKKHRTVCVWEGTTSVEVLNKPVYAEMDVRHRADAGKCLEAVSKGELDAMSTDQMILYGFAEQYKKDKEGEEGKKGKDGKGGKGKGLTVLADTVGAPQHYGIGMAKGHHEDCLKLRDIVKKYVSSSIWERDLEESLPLLTEQDNDWKTRYRPSDSRIDALSCRDVPSP